MRLQAAIAAIILSAGCAFGNFAELVKQGDVYDAQFKPEAALQYYLPAEKLEPNNGFFKGGRVIRGMA